MQVLHILPTYDALTGRGYLREGERCIDLQIDVDRVLTYKGFFLTEESVTQLGAEFGLQPSLPYIQRVADLEASVADLHAENAQLRRAWRIVADAIDVVTGDCPPDIDVVLDQLPDPTPGEVLP